jgi:hypothetical protein
LECTTNETIPTSGLIVWELKSNTYLWDDEKPVCIRGGYDSSFTHFLGSEFRSDTYLSQILATTQVISRDKTIFYLDNNDAYNGEWTNRVLKAK